MPVASTGDGPPDRPTDGSDGAPDDVPGAGVPDASRGASEGIACRRTAMDLLARREHARTELEAKLGDRGYEPPLIAATLDALERDGLLSETRFVESFVASRVRRGQGPVRIGTELARRGIDDAEARAGLEAVEVDWTALARETRDARFGDNTPGNYREWARQARFLQYRGFTSEQIRNALGDFGV